MDEIIDAPKNFIKESIQLLGKCEKPDRRGFQVNRIYSSCSSNRHGILNDWVHWIFREIDPHSNQ